MIVQKSVLDVSWTQVPIQPGNQGTMVVSRKEGSALEMERERGRTLTRVKSGRREHAYARSTGSKMRKGICV